MLKVLADYPTEEQEVSVLRVHQQGSRIEDMERFGLQTVGGEPELLAAQAAIRARVVREELLGYVAKVIRATRSAPKVEVGASPRAGLMLLTAAKARAALAGRDYMLPDDVKAVARPVLRHRLILKPAAAVDGFSPDDVLDEILARTEIPR
jgi:MoxR-like ATPase